MSKATNIEKSLAKGTAKQRVILLANHIAEVNLEGKGLLSSAEVNSLTDSFKTDQEITVYNRYRGIYDEVRNYLGTLAQLRFTYACAIEKLEKLISLRRSNYDVEDLVNNLLDLMPDKKTKAKALKRIKAFDNIALMRSIRVDKDGYVDLTEEPRLLDNAIDETRKEALLEQVRLKTGIILLKDYLSETRLKVKVFTAYVKEIENWAKSKKGLTNLLVDKAVKNNLALKEFAKKDASEKPYVEVEVDRKLYDKWRKDFFE